MTQRAVGVPDDPPGAGVAEFRTRERTVDAMTVVEQYLILQRERVRSFVGAAASFRTAGTPTHSLSILNGAGSGVLVAVLAVESWKIATSNSSASVTAPRLVRVSAASGGTVLTKVSVGTGADAAETSASQVEVRSAASADGVGTALTITETARVWSFGQPGRMLSATLQHSPLALGVPALDPVWDGADEPPIAILRAGEGLAITVDLSSSVQTLGANVLWGEYTLP